MREECVWSLRVSILLLLLRPNPLDCQLATDHRKVPQRAGPQQGPADGQPGLQGSWGSWGAWTACSRTCGGGVQQQSRPCLPSYAPPPPPQPSYPSRPGPPPHRRPQHPGHVVSALRPSVPLHRQAGTPPHSNSSIRGDLGSLQRERDARPGRRRGSDSVITPGKYGYGRMPYVAPLQTDGGVAPGSARSHRQRRAPLPDPHHPPPPTRHGGHRPSYWQQPYNNPGIHSYGPAHHPPAWGPLYQPQRPQSQPVTEQYPDGRGSGPQTAPGRPYSPLPSSSCAGQPSQHRICNANACPPSSRHIRASQCSSYNSQPFMGRLYEWEPFNEVPGDQHCELNCRAVGFRFYVRQSDRVIDGTPCGRNETSVCVAGRCQSLGCDEYLGPGRVMDRCGVCGGDNSGCTLVSGLFQHSLSKVGYHKVVEIPQGATKINVTETVKSRNYLALRSRSGRSIINGNWAIDRPGKYEGVGTMFTYARPNEITSTAGEHFLAEGPTNEILDVYVIYQQPDPGVHYEFILPSDKPTSTQRPYRPGGNALNDHRNAHQEGYDHGGGAGRHPALLPDIQVAQPPRRQREYNWKLSGATECNASCGRGSSYTVFRCVHRQSHEPASDSLCDSSTKPSAQEEPCNLQPCPAFWDIGEWSECSKSCGLGMQHRQVLCRQLYANRTLNVHTGRCRHLHRPDTASTCQLKICSEWEIRTEWSSCSVPCGVGQRAREVRCVSNVGDFVPDEECNMRLKPEHLENCDMGACAKSWFLTAWGDKCSAECGMGVRTRGVLCLTNQVSSLPLEGCGHERPANSQVCNPGPCDGRIEWFTGPWSQCSAECGAGSQQRAVVCLTRSEEGFSVTPPYECSSLDRPLAQQTCNLRACGAKWYHTDWSACSKTCEGGFRVREVRCLSDQSLTSDGCEEQLRPADREDCSAEPCIPHIDENCRDKFFNCNVVVQARLCVYDYYKTTCCASCSRVAHRQSTHRGRHS